MFSNVLWAELDYFTLSTNISYIFTSLNIFEGDFYSEPSPWSENDNPSLTDDLGGRNPESVLRYYSYCGINFPDSIENSLTFEDLKFSGG